MNLRKKAVVVTGASRGLGAALARRLGEEGARLVLTSREQAPLDALVTALRMAGVEAHALVSDIGEKSAIYPLVGAATALVGPIDVVIHNASTLGPTPLRLLLDTDCEDLTRALEVNLVGPFRLTKAVAGSMALRKTGIIVHVSSDASTEAYPSWGAYSVSKAALDHLGRLWAAELGDAGVRVFSVDPGEMNTRMHAEAMPEADVNRLSDPADVAAKIVAMLENALRIPNGARIQASTWSA